MGGKGRGEGWGEKGRERGREGDNTQAEAPNLTTSLNFIWETGLTVAMRIIKQNLQVLGASRHNMKHPRIHFKLSCIRRVMFFRKGGR